MSKATATKKADDIKTNDEPQKRDEITPPCEFGRPLLLNSNVVIRGAELIPDKLIAILDYHLLNVQKDAGVLAITFRKDNRPDNKLGVSYPWAYAASINLDGIFKKTWTKLQDQDWGLELRTAVWLGLLETVIHEITHIHMAREDEAGNSHLIVQGNETDRKEDEQDTKAFTREWMLDLMKEVDCEPPSVADMKYLGGLIMEQFMTNREHKYVKRSQKMIEDGVAYTDHDHNTYYTRLRDYIRNSWLGEKDLADKDWAEDVCLVKITFHTEDEDVVADPQPVVQAEDAIPEPPTIEPAEVRADDVALEPTPSEDEFLDEYEPNEMDAIQEVFGRAADQWVLGVEPEEDDMYEMTNVESDGTVAMAEATPPVAPVAAAAPPAAAVVSPADHSPETSLAATPPEAVPSNLPKLDISDDVLKACIQKIYIRLHSYIYDKCGWHIDPELNRWVLGQPHAVLGSIGIGDILTEFGAQGLVLEYKMYREGQTPGPGVAADTWYTCTGNIQGYLTKDKGLPCYEIALNINGERYVRRILPQNTLKVENNAYTKGADFGGIAGNRVSYVFKGEAPRGAAFKESCATKIINEVPELP